MEEAFPYQNEGAKWLVKKPLALLADEMGLGKSRQVVMAADEIGAEKILIICPATARANWQREFDTWSIFDRKFKICFELSDEPAEKTIASFTYATEVKKLAEMEWDLVVIDEAHFLKSSDAERTKAVYGKKGIIRKTKKFWAVSGTPMPNNNSELWILLRVFGVTSLSYVDFVKRYCLWYEYRGEVVVKGNRTSMDQEVRDMLSKIMLRRLKENVMTQLPEIFYSDITVEASPVDLEVHHSFIEYTFPTDRREELEIKLHNDRQLIDVSLDRLRFTKDGMKVLEGISTSVATLRRYTGLQKMPGIAAIVDQELTQKKYDKIVIFAIHRDVIEGLRVALLKHRPVTIYGRTDPKSRDQKVQRFQNDPKCRVFIGNIKAAGTAITCTAAHQVLVLEPEWTPGDNAQAIMRVHRIGQNRTVFVRFAGLANSFDQHIAQVLKRKTKEITAVIDGKTEFQTITEQGEE
jgi:SWI/SNF-related matrix-associated actin-dependent regulator 1 of chromatin subfamily A